MGTARRLAIVVLLCLAGGGGAGLLVSSAHGQGSAGEPLLHDNGPIIFDFVPVGSTSEPKTVTLGNAGEGVLEISSIEVSGPVSRDFSILSDECLGKLLGAGQSCSLSVVFHPVRAGTLVGSLIVGGAREACKNYVNLAGSGTETQKPATAHAAACVVTGPTTVLPGKIVAVPGPTVTAPAPGPEADILQLLTPPRCVSGRHISMRLRTSKADSIILAWVYINGHLVDFARGHSLSALTFDLPKKPRPRYRVQIVASTATGPTLGLTRYFETCHRGSRHGAKGR